VTAEYQTTHVVSYSPAQIPTNVSCAEKITPKTVKSAHVPTHLLTTVPGKSSNSAKDCANGAGTVFLPKMVKAVYLSVLKQPLITVQWEEEDQTELASVLGVMRTITLEKTVDNVSAMSEVDVPFLTSELRSA